jgi:phage tail sheath protein FI
MPEYLAPGVYIEEVTFRALPIEGVSTSTAGFIGAADGRQLLSGITSFGDFERQAVSGSSDYLSSAVRGFFHNGGTRCFVALIAGTDRVETALEALANEPVSILCCPDEYVFPNAARVMTEHCERRKDRFCILQSPEPAVPIATHEPPVNSSYAAYYHPWLVVPAPDRVTTLTVPPGGHVAGVYARTDLQRGVWKTSAGVRIEGVTALSENVTPADADLLVDRGIDILRNEPGRGIVVSAGRTTTSDPEWKYINVRRFLIFVERSIDRGLQWVVFEPNGVAVWEIVRHAIDAFLLGLWRSGALMGQTAAEAYFVRCDRTTMTLDDIANGRLVALVGIAPVRPAEFVILRITCVLRQDSSCAGRDSI